MVCSSAIRSNKALPRDPGDSTVLFVDNSCSRTFTIHEHEANPLFPAIAAACLFHSIRVEGGHPTVSCYTSRKSEQLIASQCLRALDTIIWDQNLNLDSTSNPLVVGYAECMVERIALARAGYSPEIDSFATQSQIKIEKPRGKPGGVSSYIHGMSAQVYPASAGDIDNINLPVVVMSLMIAEMPSNVGPDPAMVYLSPSSFTSGNCTLCYFFETDLRKARQALLIPNPDGYISAMVLPGPLMVKIVHSGSQCS
ncbi:hypothetical protein H4Q26_013635 [Puccinia striiformis f. sp. tritici PST-130]|nr:hypothetical protein H4Q26_013635 [Puccinia striiformis f. sp. tritici PST-130]